MLQIDGSIAPEWWLSHAGLLALRSRNIQSWSKTISRGIPPKYLKQLWLMVTKSAAVKGRLCISAYLYRDAESKKAAASNPLE